MKQSFWQRLDVFSRQVVPSASTFAAIVLDVLPMPPDGLHAIAPSLPIIAVFYWTLHRPDLMPALAVFLFGLVQDSLSGQPLGVGACMLLFVHAAVQTQRRFLIGKPFGITWLGFAVVTSGALLLGWLLTAAYHVALVPAQALAFQALTTVGTFPLLCWALMRCQLALLRQV